MEKPKRKARISFADGGSGDDTNEAEKPRKPKSDHHAADKDKDEDDETETKSSSVRAKMRALSASSSSGKRSSESAGSNSAESNRSLKKTPLWLATLDHYCDLSLFSLMRMHAAEAEDSLRSRLDVVFLNSSGSAAKGGAAAASGSGGESAEEIKNQIAIEWLTARFFLMFGLIKDGSLSEYDSLLSDAKHILMGETRLRLQFFQNDYALPFGALNTMSVQKRIMMRQAGDKSIGGEEVDDKRLLSAAKRELRLAAKGASAVALQLAARLFIYQNKLNKARQCLEKFLRKHDKRNVAVLSSYGWMFLRSASASHQTRAMPIFRKAMKISYPRMDPLAMIGRCRALQLASKWNKALNDVQAISKIYATGPQHGLSPTAAAAANADAPPDAFAPAIHMRLETLVMNNHWKDAAREAASCLERADAVAPKPSAAIVSSAFAAGRKVSLLHTLLFEGDSQAAETIAKGWTHSIHSLESQNPALSYDAARLIARLSQRDGAIVARAREAVEQAMALRSDVSAFYRERASQQLAVALSRRTIAECSKEERKELRRAGRAEASAVDTEACEFNLASAKADFETALKLKETNACAAIGLIRVSLASGEIDEASRALATLPPATAEEEKAEWLYCRALLAFLISRRSENEEEQRTQGAAAMELLIESVETHMVRSRDKQQSAGAGAVDTGAAAQLDVEFWNDYQPDFVCDLMALYVKATGDSLTKSSAASPKGGAANSAHMLVSALCDHLLSLMPAHQRARMMRARLHFMAGEHKDVHRQLGRALRLIEVNTAKLSAATKDEAPEPRSGLAASVVTNSALSAQIDAMYAVLEKVSKYTRPESDVSSAAAKKEAPEYAKPQPIAVPADSAVAAAAAATAKKRKEEEDEEVPTKRVTARKAVARGSERWFDAQEGDDADETAMLMSMAETDMDVAEVLSEDEALLNKVNGAQADAEAEAEWERTRAALEAEAAKERAEQETVRTREAERKQREDDEKEKAEAILIRKAEAEVKAVLAGKRGSAITGDSADDEHKESPKKSFKPLNITVAWASAAEAAAAVQTPAVGIGSKSEQKADGALSATPAAGANVTPAAGNSAPPSSAAAATAANPANGGEPRFSFNLDVIGPVSGEDRPKTATPAGSHSTRPKSHSALMEKKGKMQAAGNEIEMAKTFVRHAFYGEVFIKHGRRGAPHDRTVSVEVTGRTIKIDWNSGSFSAFKDQLQLLDGKQTPVFQRDSAKKAKSELCFSLVTNDRSLDLEAKTMQAKQYWFSGFTLLLKYLK